MPARTLGVVVLSATVAAVGSGPVAAADSKAGWAAAAVRFEPVGGGADGLTVAGTGTYRGAVEVRRHGRALAVVNHLGLEEYVRGIDEVPPSWPAAVLQAQAIAARTYAAHKVAGQEAAWRAVGADICATPRCQVYRGLEAERKAQGYGWLAAVEATAGRALLAGGRPIMASYSATANGPRAMSQNGALEMARQGRSATEILSAYYDGIRPTQAADRLPATIRVALSTSASTVRISAAVPFRVVDGGGTQLAAAGGAGEWRVVTDAGGVRVVPPESHQDVDPAGEPVGDPVAARRPGRALTAASVPGAGPVRGVTASLALALVVVAGAAAITLSRRRDA